MRKILILTGRYLPGYKDGGPLRTIANVTDALGDEYDFYIGCLDRDHGDTEPYKGIKKNEWNKVGKANVWYVKQRGFSFRLIQKLAKDKNLIYLTSFYDDYGYKTLLLKRLGRIKIPVVLASMGVFAEGALSHNRGKKMMFITACKAIGLFRGITWSVTSAAEANDLQKVLGLKERWIIAEDLPRSNFPDISYEKHDVLRIVFLSRICAHKGLEIAIEAVLRMKNKCVFSIYGPIQDEEYWHRCRSKLEKSGIDWNYLGEIPSEDVQETLSHEDVLVLPTKSENYGHVIYEAMSVGCIPIISPFTPWGEIVEKNAGFVIDNDPVKISMILDSLDDAQLGNMKSKAIEYAKRKTEEAHLKTGYRTIFEL